MELAPVWGGRKDAAVLRHSPDCSDLLSFAGQSVVTSPGHCRGGGGGRKAQPQLPQQHILGCLRALCIPSRCRMWRVVP